MLGDLHTPVSTYLKVRDIFPQSALMESSDYHGSENNRSFIALCPLASVSIDHGTVIFRLPDDSREEHPITDTYRVENALNDFRAASAWRANTAITADSTDTPPSMLSATSRISP